MSKLLELIDAAVVEMSSKKLADTNQVTDLLLDIRNEALRLPVVAPASKLLQQEQQIERVATRSDE